MITLDGVLKKYNDVINNDQMFLNTILAVYLLKNKQLFVFIVNCMVQTSDSQTFTFVLSCYFFIILTFIAIYMSPMPLQSHSVFLYRVTQLYLYLLYLFQLRLLLLQPGFLSFIPLSYYENNLIAKQQSFVIAKQQIFSY